jgi:hypothetical protein
MRSRYLLSCGLALILGCGGSKYASVSGTVTDQDGKPVAYVVVLFQPTGGGQINPGPGSSGRTDEEGKYTLELTGGGKGAVIGWHRVEIRPVVDGDDGKRGPKIPRKYNFQSELKFEVKPGDNTADFPLTLPQK